ncbi:MAG: phage major capsid protein, partial [Syntrophales bacterium]|nr:phage major capsid protein [Syntrophales bacterium]
MADELKQILDAQDALGRAWDEFKKTNDERLKAIEAKQGTGEMEAKLARIEADISNFSGQIETLQKHRNRPPAGIDTEAASEEVKAHKNAIYGREGYMRKGENGKDFNEHKAMQTGSDPDGGYLLPAPTVGAIERVAMDDVAMYNLATVTPIGGGGWSEPVVTTGMTAGHTGETGTRSETTNPKISKVDIKAEESYVMPYIYNHMLEDSELNLESWLVDESGMSFADLDDADFITGNGINCAHGIMSYTMIANASYAWGKVGY